jgi:transcriptional regulator with XRE-family HTH domain
MARSRTPARNKLDQELGLHIRERRKALGISQSALAEALGITFQQIQKYERGFNRVSFSRLVLIAQALDCRISDLIRDLDEVDTPETRPLQDTAQLRAPGAPELLAAYAASPSEIRKAVLKLVVAIAKHRRAREKDGERPGLN